MHQHGYIGRKLRTPKLKDKTAIIISAFGTSSRAEAPLEIFQKELTEHYPEYELFWAYTSDIICRKKQLPSLQETLAKVEAAGFRKAVVQPLHIFPGTEYQQMAETCEYFPGLRVFLSETLLHRWQFVTETLEIIETELLAPDEGLNILALHGSPLTADPVNAAYLGLEKLVRGRYSNVLAASLEGVPDHGALLASIERRNLSERYKKVKLIPMMYIAGMHAEKDLMGDSNSWRAALEAMGFTVECPMVSYDGSDYFKGLAHYPQVISSFLERLRRSLDLAELY